MNTKLLLFLTLAVTTATAIKGWNVPKETVTYDVTYKWGLINKKAGEVEISTSPNHSTNKFDSELVAASASWADKFYMLRDTLKGTIDMHTFTPSYYERIAHEGGAFQRDILIYDRSGKNVRANATLWRRRKKETEIRKSFKEYEASGLTLDMLSSFYYMRQIDYERMGKGNSVKLNVFSGSKKEILTISYKGVEMVELKNKRYPAYHITFSFTTEGGKTSSDNMDAWISATSSRIPLLLEGKLPVGKVRALYSGKL